MAASSKAKRVPVEQPALVIPTQTWLVLFLLGIKTQLVLLQLLQLEEQYP